MRFLPPAELEGLSCRQKVESPSKNGIVRPYFAYLQPMSLDPRHRLYIHAFAHPRFVRPFHTCAFSVTDFDQLIEGFPVAIGSFIFIFS